MEKIIDIFYIATGIYTSYFENFLNSSKNFFPKYEKHIHVISDGMARYNGYEDGNIKIDVYYQMDLPYPIIPLLKTYFIKRFLIDEMKYIFYCDADTIFLERNEDYWDNLMNNMEEGKIIGSIHPQDVYPNYGINEESKAFIPMGKTYKPLIASFYGGTRDKMETLIENINYMIKQDLNYHRNDHQWHYMPPLFDQDYLNKTVSDMGTDNFYLQHFVGIPWLMNNEDDQNEECVLQKYEISLKFETKNMLS